MAVILSVDFLRKALVYMSPKEFWLAEKKGNASRRRTGAYNDGPLCATKAGRFHDPRILEGWRGVSRGKYTRSPGRLLMKCIGSRSLLNERDV